MRLITVKLVHSDGRIIKVNANEVPVWKLRGFNIPEEGKTSGGEPRTEQHTGDKLANEAKPAADNSMSDIII